MPYLKTEIISARNDAGASETFKAKISVNTTGDFYTYFPDYLKIAVDNFTGIDVWRGYKEKSGSEDGQLFSNSLPMLVRTLKQALKLYLTPEVTEELIISYNIESHVSFAEDEQGTIYPNAAFEGASWPDYNIKSMLYGDHNAAKPSSGGYSLKIGAEAYRKITHHYGEKKKIKYERYYGEGNPHHEREHPAGLLNSWCSFYLPEDAKEMPYTDEAATFFYNLMFGMADLSRRIQHFASDKDRLLQLIASNNSLLLAPPIRGK